MPTRTIFTIIFVALLGSLAMGQTRTLALAIKPVFGHQEFHLNSSYVTPNSDTIKINTAKLYLADFTIIFQNGTVYREPASYHLLNLEQSSSLKWEFSNVPSGKIASITFTIGLDSATSCSGALSGDLDPMYGMYWAWNSGYINAKLEGQSSACPTRNHEFQFHIGGYKAKEATIQTVHLDTKKNIIKTLDIVMDLQAWFNQVDLSKENTILMPGPAAMNMAKRYKQMFSISK